MFFNYLLRSIYCNCLLQLDLLTSCSYSSNDSYAVITATACTWTHRVAGVTNSLNYISNANHKILGLYYLWLAIIFGIFGALLSVLIRIELYESGVRIIPNENQNFYNIIFTLHGLIMLLFFIQPALFSGFGNYLLPIFNGATEVAFPRLNSISLCFLPVAYALLILSVTTEFGGGAGWTLYPPLSTSTINLGTDAIIMGIAVGGFSSFLTSINFVTTIYHIRSKGLILGVLPFFIYAYIFTAYLLILTLPVVSGGLFMLLSDMHLNTMYYDPAYSGDPVLFQHLFWFFGHPEVYVLILPAFGIISLILSYTYSSMVFGYQSMVLAMGCISIIGCMVWGHHMYTVGMEADTRAYFTIITILISLPTGTKVFNWLSTYMGSVLQLTLSSSLNALLFIFTFTLGGSTGVVLGNGFMDIALHDTYYVVAHFHFVLSLGATIGLISGIFLLQELLLGSTISFNFIQLIFTCVFFTGVMLTFIPMHFLGFHVMPRRISDYPDSFNSWNYICSIGSLLSFFALLLLL